MAEHFRAFGDEVGTIRVGWYSTLGFLGMRCMGFLEDKEVDDVGGMW